MASQQDDKEQRRTASDRMTLAVEIIYDAPRTAAWDALWRKIINAALDELDAEAAAEKAALDELNAKTAEKAREESQ